MSGYSIETRQSMRVLFTAGQLCDLAVSMEPSGGLLLWKNGGCGYTSTKFLTRLLTKAELAARIHNRAELAAWVYVK
jgi:hypothetical protein